MSDTSPPPLPPTEPLGPVPTEPGTTAVLERRVRTGEPRSPRRRRTRVIVASVGAAVALIVAAAVGYWSAGDDDDVATGPSTTLAPSTSTPVSEQPSTTVTDTTAATTTTTVASSPPVDASTAIFPYASGTVRFDDPIDAARGFAVDFAGFADPVLGDFMQGDARSGEVEIQPVANGPKTTLFVRQLGDDSWWVLGAVTDDIDVVQPPMGARISSPVTVSGTALAFEGHVNVEVRQDGTTEPLGSGFVTGGGGPAAPFNGQVEFAPPTEAYGAMVFTTNSAENGEVWQIAAYRIRFA